MSKVKSDVVNIKEEVFVLFELLIMFYVDVGFNCIIKNF